MYTVFWIWRKTYSDIENRVQHQNWNGTARKTGAVWFRISCSYVAFSRIQDLHHCTFLIYDGLGYTKCPHLQRPSSTPKQMQTAGILGSFGFVLSLQWIFHVEKVPYLMQIAMYSLNWNWKPTWWFTGILPSVRTTEWFTSFYIFTIILVYFSCFSYSYSTCAVFRVSWGFFEIEIRV